MSTTTAANFNDTAYATPDADLVDHASDAQFPDKVWSRKGRIGVKGYNARMLWALPLMMLSLVPVFALAMLGEEVSTLNPILLVVGGLLFAALFIYSMVVMIASAAKRLHDIGKSAWYMLIGGIPIVGVFYQAYYAFTPGKDEVNEYGAYREPTRVQSIAGTIGIVLMALMLLSSIVDSFLSVSKLMP